DDGLATAADRDGLSTAGPAGVLMRLNDARRHDEVGILHELLREARDAVRRDGTKIGPLRRIATIRVDDANTIDDRPKLLALLGIGRRAMQADADHHGDVSVRDPTGVELVEKGRNENRVRRCPREIGDRDDRARLPWRGALAGIGCERAERRRY